MASRGLVSVAFPGRRNRLLGGDGPPRSPIGGAAFLQLGPMKRNPLFQMIPMFSRNDKTNALQKRLMRSAVEQHLLVIIGGPGEPVIAQKARDRAGGKRHQNQQRSQPKLQAAAPKRKLHRCVPRKLCPTCRRFSLPLSSRSHGTQTKEIAAVCRPFAHSPNIAENRRCISAGETASICEPSSHSWPNGSSTLAARSP